MFQLCITSYFIISHDFVGQEFEQVFGCVILLLHVASTKVTWWYSAVDEMV